MTTRLHIPTVLLLALLATLVLAATAAAETRRGEATSTTFVEPAEADITGATASYESTAGTVTFTVTTRAAPTDNPLLELGVLLGTGAQCNEHPNVGMLTYYNEPQPEAEWEAEAAEGAPPTEGPLAKTISGATTSLSATDASLADRPYSCAIVFTVEDEETLLDRLQVPLGAAPTTPPPVTPPAPTPAMPAAPASTPAALSIGKLKPLKLKAGKWGRVKVKISDTGGGATSPGGLKVKAPKGVVLKPGSGKLTLAALQPGETKTVSFKVKLTETAKAKSTLALTGTAGSLMAKGSVVVKLTG